MTHRCNIPDAKTWINFQAIMMSLWRHPAASQRGLECLSRLRFRYFESLRSSKTGMTVTSALVRVVSNSMITATDLRSFGFLILSRSLLNFLRKTTSISLWVWPWLHHRTQYPYDQHLSLVRTSLSLQYLHQKEPLTSLLTYSEAPIWTLTPPNSLDWWLLNS